MRFVYYCMECGYLGTIEGDDIEKACPQCGKTLFPTHITKDDWLMLDSQEKTELKEKWKRQKQISHYRDTMMLSTCPSIEGYTIKKQFGLVFGECLFKAGFLKSISATFANIGSVLSFGDQELAGTTALLDNAREYAINKMIDKAGDLGANAIIGIDSESSAGGDIIHIAIMGTAVYVEPIEQ